MHGKRVTGFVFSALLSLQLSNGGPQLDPNFKPEFEPDVKLANFILRPSGEIVASVFRFESNGTVTRSLEQLKPDGKRDHSFQSASASWGRMQLLPGGDLLLRNAQTLVRLLPTGELDSTFAPPPFAPHDFAADQHGRTYIVGDFFRTPTNGVQRLYISRLHQDGRLDESFIPETTRHASRESGMVTVTVQPDGKPILGGVFRSPVEKHHFARFTEDGSDDPTFSNLNSMLSSFCHSLRVLPDGSILHLGPRMNSDGRTFTTLQRFLPDRTRDPSFRMQDYDYIGSLDVQKDGKIIAAVANAYGEQLRLVRFHKNGTVDDSFDSPRFSWHDQIPRTDRFLGPISIQADGDILVGGTFTSVDDQSVTNLVRFIGERAYVTGIEPKQNSLQVSWLLTEPEKAYSPQTSTDLLTWTDHNDFTRSGDRLTVTMPATRNQRFIRAIQK